MYAILCMQNHCFSKTENNQCTCNESEHWITLPSFKYLLKWKHFFLILGKMFKYQIRIIWNHKFPCLNIYICSIFVKFSVDIWLPYIWHNKIKFIKQIIANIPVYMMYFFRKISKYYIDIIVGSFCFLWLTNHFWVI